MRFALTVLIPTLLCAQNVEKTLTFEHSKTLEQAQEIATALTTLGQAGAQATESSITVTGTQAQIDFATWTVSQLDGKATTAQHSASTDFPFAGDKIRILRVANAPSKQAFLEMATAIRSLGEIRYVFGCYLSGAFIFRAQPADLDAAEWTWTQLDRTTAGEGFQFYKRPIPANPTRSDLEDTFIVLPVSRPQTVQEFQEIATSLRSITEVRSVYSYNSLKTIVARASGPMVDMVTWLARQLNQPPAPDNPPTFRLPAVDDGISLVYFPSTQSVSDFQAEATRIRKATGIRRAYTYNLDRVLIARGTAAELAQVKELAAGDPKK